MRQEKGFTLLEVLIGAVLILIGAGSMGITVTAVKRSLKESENRAQAMRVAARKIDEFLGKAYSEDQQSKSDKEGIFDWVFNVYTETATGSIANIPYKRAESVVSYTADKGSGGIQSIRSVRLSNIIAYPLVHLTAVRRRSDENAEVPWVSAEKTDPFSLTGSSSDGIASVAGSDDAGLLELSGLRYNVDKTVEVTYTIALNVEDTDNEIGTVDTVFTACFLDEAQYGLVTRTPLLTQPSFSNKIVLSKDLVKKDTPHIVHIRWYYNANETGKKPEGAEYSNNVKISLREAELSVLAVE